MKTDTIFELDPSDIRIQENLPRYRKDTPNIKQLLMSIEQFGQFVPIILTKNNTLVAGGRRLAACLLGERKVRCIYQENLSNLQLREIELEENIQRESYTPADEADAVSNLHEIKTKLYGESGSGMKTGWRLQDTAEAIGKTKGTVIDNIMISEALKSFPELRVLKTKKAIKRAVRSANQIVERELSVQEWREKLKKQSEVQLDQEDAFKHMPAVPDDTIDLLLTDPPYGIEIDKLAQHLDSKTGGHAMSGYKFKDGKEQSLAIYRTLAKESFRFCKQTSHAFVFLAPEFFWTVRDMFEEAGWSVWIRPMLWIKPGTGQTNQPTKWPSPRYEMILYARQEQSSLVIQGRNDWIECPIVNPNDKIHPTEKPVNLLSELIARTTMPGECLYDPFMGSGATIEAGARMNLICNGCDIDKEAYNAAIERIVNYQKAREV